MKKYEKTKEDDIREKSDLESNPIMRWLQNQDAFKFNVGDILIKKTLRRSWNPQSHNHTETWDTEVITKNTGAPRKYVYAFENKLGIGYIRQLKVDGSGYTSQLICVANFDPVTTRFELDPDFVDHTLVGEGDFQYNTEYLNKKKFRAEAMEKNKAIMVKTSSDKQLIKWYTGLKPGDEFWFGGTFDEFVGCKYRVLKIENVPAPAYRDTYNFNQTDAAKVRLSQRTDLQWTKMECEVLEHVETWTKPGSTKSFVISDFSWKKVSHTKPHPMKDPLCAPPK